MWLWYVAAALSGLLSFATLIGLDVVGPNAAVWKNPPYDLAQMLGGFYAIDLAPWAFPVTVSTRLAEPLPISIVYTDSIPWLALALKALHLGPDLVNPLGLALLLGNLLQPMGMIAVLRALDVRRGFVLAAGLGLALLMPTWISRQFSHVALSFHWLILLALALALQTIRTRLTPRIGIRFVLLGILAAGIHPYQLVPVSACCGTAILSDWISHRRMRAGLGTGIGYMVALVVATWFLGYADGGGSAAAGGLGSYQMNLLAPVLPEGSELLGHGWNGGTPAGTIYPPRQWVEGYQYLGVGLLVLMSVAAFLMAVPATLRRRATLSRPELKRYLPLGATCLLLTIWAVLPDLYVGRNFSLHVPLPQRVDHLLSIFRSNGRFFWLPAYTALAASLAILDRLASPAIGIAVAVAALALQLADTAGLRAAVRGTYAIAQTRKVPELGEPWAALRGWDWRIFPPAGKCLTSIPALEAEHEIALIALRSGGRTDAAPLARDVGFDCQEPLPARVPHHTLVVLFQDGLHIATLAEFANTHPCSTFRFGLLCGTDIPSILHRPQVDGAALLPALTSWSTPIAFDGGAAPSIRGQGWSQPEGWGTWTNGHQARLIFRPPSGVTASSTMHVSARAFARPGDDTQDVQVYVNGLLRTAWRVRAGPFQDYVVNLPAAPAYSIRLQIPRASASEGDPRVLGLAVQKIYFTHAPMTP